jgi:hypothetical protein
LFKTDQAFWRTNSTVFPNSYRLGYHFGCDISYLRCPARNKNVFSMVQFFLETPGIQGRALHKMLSSACEWKRRKKNVDVGKQIA